MINKICTGKYNRLLSLNRCKCHIYAWCCIMCKLITRKYNRMLHYDHLCCFRLFQGTEIVRNVKINLKA